MEKEPQPDSFTTVKVKDYPPVLGDIYGNEPPPAYKKPKSSLVQIVRIVAVTIVALTITIGLFHLSSIYIQANAVHRLQQLQNRHVQKINQIPKAEPLVQQEKQSDDDAKLDGAEARNHVKRDFIDNNKIDNDNDNDNDDDDNSDDQEDQDSDLKNPLHNIKFPIQLDLDDLPDALLGGGVSGANKNNKKSRMNCIVEKKLAEKMINHEPKNIQLPFGVNLTTDKGYEHLTGEKVIILCESGSSEQQPESEEKQPEQPERKEPQIQQKEPEIQQPQQNVQPLHFIRNERYPVFAQPDQQQQELPVQPQQQFMFPNPEISEMDQRHLPPFLRFPQPISHNQFLRRRPNFPFRPAAAQQQQHRQMIIISPRGAPFVDQPEMVEKEPERIPNMMPPILQSAQNIIPPFIKNIAEEIIREHIESMRKEQMQGQGQAEVNAEVQVQDQDPAEKIASGPDDKQILSQRLPLPETLLSEINRLPSREMILSITAAAARNADMDTNQHNQEEVNDEDKQVVVEHEPEVEQESGSEHESGQQQNVGVPSIMEIIHEAEMKSEQRDEQEQEPEIARVQEPEHESEPEPEPEQKDQNEAKLEQEPSAKETTSPPHVVMAKQEESTTMMNANTANVRAGRQLQPLEIPVQMVPQQEANEKERPHCKLGIFNDKLCGRRYKHENTAFSA